MGLGALAVTFGIFFIDFLVGTDFFSFITHKIWGKFDDRNELKKFAKLAAVFFCVICVYWGLRPLKDSIFTSVIGIDYQPLAKMLSPFIIMPLVILYSKLIDMFPRNKVFYVLLSIYGVAALIFSLIFTVWFDLTTVIASPYNFLGWAWYVYVESFGSLVVALFWGFTTDITVPTAAKRGFPLIYLFGQFGNVMGPLVMRAERFGFASNAPVIALLAILMFVTGFLMWVFVSTTPASQLKGYEAKKGKKEEKKGKEAGFLDGLKLLFSHGYLIAITGIIMFYEIVVTILDFFFKAAAAEHFRRTVPAEIFEKSFGAYLGDYGVWTGIVATLCVLFGINNIHRKLGTAVSLVLLPTLVGVAVLVLRLSPTLQAAFWIMVFSKAVNYALNQPTIKQLYIPTTKDTKYKAQAWIEMFGSRGSKALGSTINLFRGFLKSRMGAQAGVALFVTLSTGVSFGLIAVWFLAAIYAAKQYNKAIAEDRVVC